MRRIATALILALASYAAADPVATVTGGQVRGRVLPSGIAAYKGLPFAAPPVGDLRWRAPKPVVAWQGVREAEHFSAGCVQNLPRSRDPWTKEFMHQGEVSEDCMYLNVWTGAKKAREKRPVFVWIYGGGFNEGSTAVAAYDGEELARKGLVVVSMNYRLNVFGFFAHPDLTRESDVKASGNYGLLDQLAALEWVHKNIARFGGDPARVTIAGQSAGAMSVHALTASPLAKGLFERAIAESGSGVGRPSRTLAEAEQEGVRFAAAKGARSIAELRAMPASQLAARVEGAQFGWRPVVDGWFLPEDIAEIFAHGKQNDVPTLTGMTADEGSSSPGYGKLSAEEYEKQVRQRFGGAADQVLRLYPVSAQKDSARDQGLVSMYLWAKNRAATARTKVYTYYWDHPEPGPNKNVFGTFHTSEVPYVFNSLRLSDRPWEPADREIAQMMTSYWANFAANGDPNGKDLTAWPAFDPAKPVTMELGDHTGPRVIADPVKLELFEQYFAKLQ
jgi:para-nitrobenzyl esterase